MLPDPFVGIQFGRVRRQRDQMQAAGAGQELVDRLAAMDGAVVQDDEHVAADVAQQVAEEHDHGLALDVVVIQVAVEGAVEPPGADGEARDGGDPIAALAMPDEGRLTDRTPRLAHRRNQEEAGFVDKDEMGCQPRGVFFTAGQTARFQCAMAASSRSSARRSGF